MTSKINTHNSSNKFNTKIIKVSESSPLTKDLIDAIELIKAGEVVAFPTETVYGLGANALNANAVSKIFKAKGRPADNPIIVHVSSYEMFSEVTSIQAHHDDIRKLQHSFWPGPLTLIVAKSEKVPYITTGNLETVAVRMPVHPVALELIKQSNIPIAAPSANISGRPSPTTAQDVFEDMKGKIPMIIDAGHSIIGLESTVLDISDPNRTPMILRPGKITKDQIEACIGKKIEILDVNDILQKTTNLKVKSPGLKYRHYAPKADVVLVSNLNDFLDSYNELKQQKKSIGIICDSKHLPDLKNKDIIVEKSLIYNYSTLEEFGSNLYLKLRELDAKNVSTILIIFNEKRGFAEAIFNRLVKASSKK